MKATFAPLISLLASDAILILGHGLLLTLLPVTATSHGLSPLQVALTGSAYFLGFISGCLLTPHIVRRVGHIRSFAVLAALYASSILLLSMNSLLPAWLLLRFAMGAVISGLYTIIESWLNDRADATNRGTVLSVYAMLNMVMIALAQQLLNLSSGSSDLLFAIAAICICLAIIPVSLTLTLAPAPVKNVSISLKKCWHHSHTGMLAVIVAGLITGAFWSLAPVFAAAIDFDNAQIAWFMSATVLGGALFQLPIGKLSDRLDRRLVLVYMAMAGAFISALFWFTSAYQLISSWSAALLAFLWGGSCTTLYAIALAHANDRAPPEDFVEIGSSMLLVLGASSAVGAPLASLSMHALGPGGLYAYMTCCALLFSLVVVVRRHKHPLVSTEHAETYQVVPNMTAPTVFNLDPRHEESHEKSPPVDG